MLIRRIEDILSQKIVEQSPLAGGCIARAQKVVTQDGQAYFLKSGGEKGMFVCEAHGLQEIARSKSIAVPEVIAYADDFLLLSFISPGQRSAHFFEDFGRAYAAMHRFTQAHFGFYENNYIGLTPQLNMAEGDEQMSWPLFYFNKRLSYQYHLAEQQHYVDARMRKAFAALENKFPSIITDEGGEASLLHGDLWGGNFMHGSSGEAVLIDPAVYYGHREADLAMTKIFGGFPPAFYAAYQASFPLADGWEYREPIYRLYHILNHLNLFGASYYAEALQLMEYYV